MDPRLARYTLVSGFFVFILSIGVLPFLSPDKPEYVPDILAIIVSAIFIALVIFDVRREAKKELMFEGSKRQITLLGEACNVDVL